MSTATLTTKGQTTIPKLVRDKLGLRPGDRMEFVVQDDGTAVLIPATLHLKDIKGILPRPAKPVTIEEMEDAIRKRAGRS